MDITADHESPVRPEFTAALHTVGHSAAWEPPAEPPGHSGPTSSRLPIAVHVEIMNAEEPMGNPVVSYHPMTAHPVDGPAVTVLTHPVASHHLPTEQPEGSVGVHLFSVSRPTFVPEVTLTPFSHPPPPEVSETHQSALLQPAPEVTSQLPQEVTSQLPPEVTSQLPPEVAGVLVSTVHASPEPTPTDKHGSSIASAFQPTAAIGQEIVGTVVPSIQVFPGPSEETVTTSDVLHPLGQGPIPTSVDSWDVPLSTKAAGVVVVTSPVLNMPQDAVVSAVDSLILPSATQAWRTADVVTQAPGPVHTGKVPTVQPSQEMPPTRGEGPSPGAPGPTPALEMLSAEEPIVNTGIPAMSAVPADGDPSDTGTGLSAETTTMPIAMSPVATFISAVPSVVPTSTAEETTGMSVSPTTMWDSATAVNVVPTEVSVTANVTKTAESADNTTPTSLETNETREGTTPIGEEATSVRGEHMTSSAPPGVGAGDDVTEAIATPRAPTAEPETTQGKLPSTSTKPNEPRTTKTPSGGGYRTTTKVYVKPTEPTKYPPHPNEILTSRSTTPRTTTTATRGPHDSSGAISRFPVYITAKLRMSLQELCAQMHAFSDVILRLLETKLGSKAFQYTVVVVEESMCVSPDQYPPKLKRHAGRQRRDVGQGGGAQAGQGWGTRNLMRQGGEGRGQVRLDRPGKADLGQGAQGQGNEGWDGRGPGQVEQDSARWQPDTRDLERQGGWRRVWFGRDGRGRVRLGRDGWDGRRAGRGRRSGPETTVNFFLVDPRGKYDVDATGKLAELIEESRVDASGTAFAGKVSIHVYTCAHTHARTHALGREMLAHVGRARTPTHARACS